MNLFSFIDFFAVSDAKHDDVVALYVEDQTIITDTEAVGAEFRVGQSFGVLERIVSEAKKGLADALFDTVVKPVNVPERLSGYIQADKSMPEYLIVRFNTTGLIIRSGFLDASQVLRGSCRKQFLQEGIPISFFHGLYSTNDFLPG
jgi:hypothetical protein